MARIQLGSIVSDIRGKVGDQIFSRNAHGLYVKAFAIPTGIPSLEMVTMRDRMRSVSQTWRTLTQVQRDRWIMQANLLGQKSRRFNREVISGFNLYVRTNCWRLLVNQTMLDVPSSLASVATYKTEPTYLFPPLIESSFIWFSGSDQWKLLCYSPIDQNKTRMSPNLTPYKFMGAVSFQTPNEEFNTTYFNRWEDVYGSGMPPNRAFFSRQVLVNTFTGQKQSSVVLRMTT